MIQTARFDKRSSKNGGQGNRFWGGFGYHRFLRCAASGFRSSLKATETINSFARCEPMTPVHNFAFRNRSALPMTETELRLMAAPAMMGLSSKPKNG